MILRMIVGIPLPVDGDSSTFDQHSSPDNPPSDAPSDPAWRDDNLDNMDVDIDYGTTTSGPNSEPSSPILGFGCIKYATEPSQEELKSALLRMNIHKGTDISPDEMELYLWFVNQRYDASVLPSTILGFHTDPGIGINIYRNAGLAGKKKITEDNLKSALNIFNSRSEMSSSIADLETVLGLVNQRYYTNIRPVDVLAHLYNKVDRQSMGAETPPTHSSRKLPVQVIQDVRSASSDNDFSLSTSQRSKIRVEGPLREELSKAISAYNHRTKQKYSLAAIEDMLRNMDKNGFITVENTADLINYLLAGSG